MTTKKSEPLPSSPVVEINHYADLSDTSHLIKSKEGMFYCYTHLGDLPLEKQSSDPRYCQQCYEVLKDEYRDMVKSHTRHRSWWVPVNSTGKPDVVKTSLLLGQGGGIMHTVNSQNSTVCKINPAVPQTTMPVFIDGRGRKPTDLPVEQIKELSDQGMGSKMIAAKLQETGISISYSTILRRLKKMLGRRTV
jgi:hypothetical protein